MTLEDWKRLIGKPLPRWRTKEKRWELRKQTKGIRESDYAPSLEDLARKLKPELFELKQPPEQTPLWGESSIGKWVETDFLPLYDNGRRADKTKANVTTHLAKLLEFQPDGKTYLADLPPKALTLVVLTRAFEQAKKSYNSDNSLASMCRTWNRLLSLMALAELVNVLLPKKFAQECPAPAYKRKEAAPDVETVMRVVNANPGNPVSAVLLAALLLGADRSEATMIPRSLLLQNVAWLKGTKNTYRDRKIPIPNDVRDALLTVCGTRYLAEVSPGNPISNNLNKRLYDACAKAGLCKPATYEKVDGKKRRVEPDPMPFTFKSVRHTFTGIEHELGCPKAVRVLIMGHSPNSIDQAYQHPGDATVMHWLSKWYSRVYTPLRGHKVGSEPQKKKT